MSGVREIKKADAGSFFDLYQLYQKRRKQDSSEAKLQDLFQLQAKKTSPITPQGFKNIFFNSHVSQELKSPPTIVAKRKKEEARQQELIQRYTQALKKDDTNPLHYINRGRVYIDIGEYELAKKDFADAIHADPKNPDSYFYMAEINYLERDLRSALNNYNESFKLGNRTSRLFFNRGYLRKYFAQYELALKDFEEALKINPDYIEIYEYQGEVYSQLGQYDHALDSYQQVIDRDPYRDQIYVERAIILSARGKVKEAFLELQDGLAFNHDSWSIYVNRAVLYEEYGDLELAEKDYRKAIELNSKDRFSHQMLAKILEKTGRAEESLVHYRTYLALELGNKTNFKSDLPSDIEKEQEKDLSFYDLALENSPNNIEIRIKRADLLRQKGEREKALDDYKAILKLNPNHTKALVMVAEYWIFKKDLRKATRFLDRAQKRNADFSEIYFYRGEIYFQQGETIRAIESLNKAIQLDNKFHQAYAKRAEIHLSFGDFFTAGRDYNKASQIAPQISSYHVGAAKAANLNDRMRIPESIFYSYEKAISLNPKNIEVLIEVINTLWVNVEFNRILDLINEAIRLGVKDYRLYEKRADIKLLRGEISASISDLDEAIKLSPKKDHLYKKRADLNILLGQFSSALKDMDHLININPDDSYLHAKKGQVLIALKKIPEAYQEFELALSLNQNNILALNGLCEILISNNDIDLALPYANRAIQIAPENFSSQLILATIHERKGDFRKAVQIYSKLIKKDETNSELYLRRGAAYERLEDTQKSLNDYKKAQDLISDESQIEEPEFKKHHSEELKEYYRSISRTIKAFPQSSTLYVVRAEISDNWLRNSKRAIQDLEKAESLDPSNIDIYKRKSDILGYADLKDRNEKAIKELEKALLIKPDDKEILNTLASKLSEMNQHDNAISKIRFALSRKPSDKELLYTLARILIEKKSYKEAIQILEKLVKSEPHITRRYSLLAKAYRLSGEISKAENILREAIRRDPLNLDFYIDLAFDFDRDGKEALTIYDSYRLVNPYNRYFYYRRIDPFLDQLDLSDTDIEDEVENTYRMMLETWPEDLDLYLEIFYHLKDKNQVITTLNKYLEYHDSDPRFYMVRSDLYASEGRIDLAWEDINKALDLEPNNRVLLSLKIDLLMKRSQKEKAIELALEFLKLDFENQLVDFNGYNYKGYEIDVTNFIKSEVTDLIAQDETDRAFSLLDKALQFKPDLPGFYMIYIDFYIRKSNYKKALKIIEKAILKCSKNDISKFLEKGVEVSDFLNQPEKKIEYLDQLIQRSRRSKKNWQYIKLELLLRLKKYDEAYQLFSELVEPSTSHGMRYLSSNKYINLIKPKLNLDKLTGIMLDFVNKSDSPENIYYVLSFLWKDRDKNRAILYLKNALRANLKDEHIKLYLKLIDRNSPEEVNQLIQFVESIANPKKSSHQEILLQLYLRAKLFQKSLDLVNQMIEDLNKEISNYQSQDFYISSNILKRKTKYLKIRIQIYKNLGGNIDKIELDLKEILEIGGKSFRRDSKYESVKMDLISNLDTQGKLDQYVGSIRKKIISEPDQFYHYQDIIEVYIYKKRFDDALELIDQYSAAHGENLDFHLLKAEIYEKKEDYISAIFHLNKAKKHIKGDIMLKSGVEASKNSAYKKLVASGSIDKVIELINQDIDNDPRNFSLYKLGADYLEESGQIDDAIAFISRFLEINSNNFHLFNYRYKLYLKQEKFDLALLDLNKLLEMKTPDYFRANYFKDRAEIYLKKGELKKAINDFESAITIKNNTQEGYLSHHDFTLSYVEALYSNGEFKKALTQINLKMDNDPNIYNFQMKALLEWRIKIYEKLGEFEKALADIEKGLEIDPKNKFFKEKEAVIRLKSKAELFNF